MIRKLKKEELRAFAKLQVQAYPGIFKGGKEELMGIVKTLERYEEEPCCFGYFQNENLIGGMILYVFEMNYRNKETILVGGLGSLAVSMAHKKEKIAYEMIRFYEQYSKMKGCKINALYPFNIRFYEKFGYGKGNKQEVLNFRPQDLISFPEAKKLRQGKTSDVEPMLDCINRIAKEKHGMFFVHEKDRYGYPQVDKQKLFVYEKNDRIEGFLIIDSKSNSSTNPLDNTLVIKQMYAESADAMHGIFKFLKNQGDQYRWIELATKDKNFHLWLEDIVAPESVLQPNVSHLYGKSGLGLMYKVLDIAYFVDAKGEQEHVGFWVVDEINRKEMYFGKEKSDKSEIKLSQKLFSSWIMGMSSLTDYVEKGLVQGLTKEQAKKLDQIYFPEEMPDCRTAY